MLKLKIANFVQRSRQFGMKRISIFLLGLLVGVGIMIWIFSPVISDALAAWDMLSPPEKGFDYEKRGQFGDSFGFATSLFSFLSFLGVLTVFVLQQRHTDVRDKPFVIARIEGHEGPLKISLADGIDEFKITLKYGINNYSEHLAHSCRFEYLWVGKDNKSVRRIEKIRYTPLIRRENDEAIEHSWICNMDDYGWFLDQISRNDLVMLHIKLTYRNSNGVSYSNTSKFNVKIDNLNSADLNAINDLRAGTRNPGNWGGGKIVELAVGEEDPFLSIE